MICPHQENSTSIGLVDLVDSEEKELQSTL